MIELSLLWLELGLSSSLSSSTASSNKRFPFKGIMLEKFGTLIVFPFRASIKGILTAGIASTGSSLSEPSITWSINLNLSLILDGESYIVFLTSIEKFPLST